MMVESKLFKGIEYVQVSELPLAQKQSIEQTVNHHMFIKILIDGRIIPDCLQYKDYTAWYNSIYKPRTAPVEAPLPSPELVLSR